MLKTIQLVDGSERKKNNKATHTAYNQKCNLCGVKANNLNKLYFGLNKPIANEKRLKLSL